MGVLLLAAFVGCNGLDRVEIVDGEHCASERDEEVACVIDGDTFNVGACGAESVRLLGVNAPEIAHDETETDECYGPEAKLWLVDLLDDVEVRLSFDATCTDAYGRTLAYAWIPAGEADGDDLLVNEALIAAGVARVYEDFDDILLADVLYSAQYAAQEAGLGLWSVCESGTGG